MTWPNVIYNEEIMREGFGIEDVGIPLEAKLELLDALSATGLKRITVGAFVSPRFVPQMACFETMLRRLRPRDGVMYLPYIHNQKARKLAEQYSPPLTIEAETFALFVDICDVHQRRNVNRSVEQLMAAWPDAVERARQQGITQGSIGIASAWGSNFMGKFAPAYRFSFLERQYELMQSAGIEVVQIGLHDSQSWCLPHEMEQDLSAIKRRWPQVRQFHLHMHDARGMALPCIYAALRTMGPNDTVMLEGTLGGIGGGQFGGNGRASGMAPTEDLLHMLEGMGIATGVDLDKIIDCVWLLEKIIGRSTFGHVSKAGPRPATPEAMYDANMPGIESLDAAKHFKLGPAAYANEGYYPWKERITGPFWRGAEAPTLGACGSTDVPVSNRA
jgi:hydroxymethylglutaryl-CoA lyase